MIINRVYGYPIGDGPLVDLGEWLQVALIPLSDGIVQDPPDFKLFTVAADLNGLAVMYRLNGVINHWKISFEDNTPTFRRISQ